MEHIYAVVAAKNMYTQHATKSMKTQMEYTDTSVKPVEPNIIRKLRGKERNQQEGTVKTSQ